MRRPPNSVAGGPLFSLTGCQLLITVEDGYLKAYASPPDASTPILSYGLEGRVRDEVERGVRQLVDEYLAANRPGSVAEDGLLVHEREPGA
jgi:hypothetical protein